jgi:hypothetical protein
MAPRSRRASSKARSPSPAAAKDQPHEEGFEFGGPPGACATMLALPCVIVGLYAACGAAGCVALDDPYGFLSALRDALSSAEPQLSPWALQVVLGWILVQAGLERLLPAEVVEGVVLADGSRLRYRMNGMLAFWASLLLLCHGWPSEKAAPVAEAPTWLQLGAFPLAVIHDEFLHLAIAAIAISSALALYLYVSSFGVAQHDGVARLLAPGGQSGWRVYDFFMGRELNPRACSTASESRCLTHSPPAPRSQNSGQTAALPRPPAFSD